MQEVLKKYKHYLIILVALLVANEITVPLYEAITVEQQKLFLTTKRVAKTEAVIAQTNAIEMNEVKVMVAKKKADSLFYKAESESQLKLLAQEKIESILAQSGCEFSAITWKGNQPLNEEISEWRIEVRYNANPSCIISATRNIEAATPVIRIGDYIYGGKKINSRPNEQLRGTLELKLWQSKVVL